MLEVEIKAHIDNCDDMRKKLEQAGCVFTDPIKQHDRVFLPAGVDYENIGPGTNVARIRTETKNGKTHVEATVKQTTTNHLIKHEAEVVVDSAEQWEAMLGLLGFTEALSIMKERWFGKMEGYGICVDEVEKLGSYIEIEAFTEKEEDAEAVQERLWDFLKQFGVGRNDTAKYGYDVLLYEYNKRL